MNLVLFDTPQARKSLRPFSYTRALAKIRIGICTIEEKWKQYLQADCSFLTAPYLSEKFPCVEAQENLCVNSTICPDEVLLAAIQSLEINQKLVKDDLLIAIFCDRAVLQSLQGNSFDPPALKRKDFEGSCTHLKNNWDIFLRNEQELSKDFEWMSQKRPTQRISDQHTITYNEAAIFLEEGSTTKAAILNAEAGSIYLGKNAQVQEGAVIRGPVAIGEAAQISANAVISNATTIGPYAKVGGEVSNSVILGYSNKAHEGFMGHSVIGEWCNWGAGSTTSNLRNDYGSVKAWDAHREALDSTDLQFCGVFMGDYSKCGIQAMFNAGTVIGVSTNLFGAGYFDKFIPSFAWGKPGESMQIYLLDKALAAAERMTRRRQVPLTAQDKKILAHVFLATDRN